MNILVLCTGNSARSILLEALLNHYGTGRVTAWSAGSHPVGSVHPGAFALLVRNGIATTGLSSKSWDRFSGSNAPAMDIVITVCDNAAGEICPVWPGTPLRVYWGVDDPAAAPEEERPHAFHSVYGILASRVRMLLREPVESMDQRSLGALLNRIGGTG